MKFLLFVSFLFVVWWIWSKRGRRPQQPPTAPPAERMVVCAHCQLHLPESDALTAAGTFYCCEAHRQAGPPAGKK